jgi:hypothetical protein
MKLQFGVIGALCFTVVAWVLIVAAVVWVIN